MSSGFIILFAILPSMPFIVLLIVLVVNAKSSVALPNLTPDWWCLVTAFNKASLELPGVPDRY